LKGSAAVLSAMKGVCSDQKFENHYCLNLDHDLVSGSKKVETWSSCRHPEC